VIDVAATVLDVIGIPEPTFVNGVQQLPMHGVSMAYLFDHADAPERRETQYFEMVCNRGIYHKGWTAVTRHSIPWLFGATLPALDDDVWELYDTSTDWTQVHDLSGEHPDKLAELQRLFLIEAVKYNVLPLDDRRIERFNSEIAGRPQLAKGPVPDFFGGMSRVTENTVLNLKNKSYSITAEVVVPEGGANGVIAAQGGAFGGWSLYLLDGVPTHCYNLLGWPWSRPLALNPSRLVPTRSVWSSATTEKVSPRVATPRCTWTAPRWHRPGRRPASPCCSRATRRSTSGATTPRR
jgi:hypothetical protein